MLKIKPVIASLLLFGLTTPAHSIVNMKSLHLTNPDEGLSGYVSFGLNGEQGNSERIRVNGGSLLQWYKPGTLRYINISGAYGESFARKDQNNVFAHMRQIREMNKHIAWEMFSQWEKDEFARLNSRTLLGGGLRFSIAEKTAKQAAFLGTGFFYSHEIIEESSTASDEGTIEDIKGNIYLILKRRMKDYLVFQSTTYIQPTVDDLEDFKLLEDASINIKLTDTIGLSLSLLVNFDNRPPQNVHKDNYLYRTSLSYDF